MFDFWNEYKYVVPKGYTRFLGKLSELTDMGWKYISLRVTTISGPMATWRKSVALPYITSPQTIEIYDKSILSGNMETGLGDPDKKFKFLKRVFQNHNFANASLMRFNCWGMAGF